MYQNSRIKQLSEYYNPFKFAKIQIRQGLGPRDSIHYMHAKKDGEREAAERHPDLEAVDICANFAKSLKS